MVARLAVMGSVWRNLTARLDPKSLFNLAVFLRRVLHRFHLHENGWLVHRVVLLVRFLLICVHFHVRGTLPLHPRLPIVPIDPKKLVRKRITARFFPRVHLFSHLFSCCTNRRCLGFI